MSDITVVSQPVIVEVSPQVFTISVSSVGAQGATGATGATGAQGNSGVVSVTAPITNSGTSTAANIGINAGVANGVATLDGSGLIPTSQLPPLAISDTFVVASQAAMLALTAQVGDVAVRTDSNQTFILQATPPSTLANWIQILTPPAVTSITASSPLTGGTITSTGTIGISDASTSVKGAVQLTDSTSSTSTTTAATPNSVKTAYDLANGKASLATANTFTTGTQIIATGSDSTVGLRVQRNSATQSANLIEVTQSNGTTHLARVDATGNVILGVAGSASGSIQFGTTGGYQLLAAGTGASNTQTLPTGANGTLLNTNITSLPSGITSIPNVTTASGLTTVGTIGSGTWQGSVIQPAYGGTGSTYGTTMVGRSFLSATRTKATNDTTPEALFWNSAGSSVQYFNVDADTTYFFDGYWTMNKGATAAAVNMSVIYLDGSGSNLTPQAISLTANYASSGAFISTITVTAANTATNGLATSTLIGMYTRFQGFIRTHATTAGKLNFGGGVSVITTGTTPTFNVGSFVQISKIGTGAATNFGNWTS